MGVTVLSLAPADTHRALVVEALDLALDAGVELEAA